MKPVRVYLDSQDFSRLANVDKSTSYGDVRQRLLALKSSGVAEFGFSFVHVVEVLKPVSGDYAEQDRAKGRLMLELCGKNVYPFISDFLGGKRFSNDGNWGPVLKTSSAPTANLEAKTKETIHEKLRPLGYNRATRRKIAARSTQREIVTRGLKQRDEQLFPGLEVFTAHEFLEALGQPSGERLLNERILQAIFDPAKYGDLLSLLGRENELRLYLEKWEREFFEHMKPHLEKFRDAYKIMIGAIEKLDQLIAAAQSVNHPDLPMIRERRRKLKRLIEDAPKTWKLPAELRHFGHYVLKTVKIGRETRDSDFRDLLHLAYAHDSDLVRVDGEMFNIFSDYKSFNGKLVANISTLPSLIESMAARLH